MSARVKWLAALALGAIVLATPALAYADEGEDEHDVARELYEHGEIASLEIVLNKLRQTTSGDVVAIDLVKVGEHWVYRFQVVAADGHRTIVDIDAGAGAARSAHDGGDD